MTTSTVISNDVDGAVTVLAARLPRHRAGPAQLDRQPAADRGVRAAEQLAAIERDAAIGGHEDALVRRIAMRPDLAAAARIDRGRGPGGRQIEHAAIDHRAGLEDAGCPDLVNAFLSSKEYPSWNFLMVSSVKPRSRK